MTMGLRFSNRLWNSDKIFNLTPVYTGASALKSIDRHDNVVITTTSVMK